MDDGEQATAVGAVGDENCEAKSAAFFQQLNTDALSTLFEVDLRQWSLVEDARGLRLMTRLDAA